MQSAGSPLWDDLRVLLALHRHRSFLAAGKALGVSTSTAARRIDALEAALGRPLVHRSNGGTFVEPDALDLVAFAEQIESGLRAIRRDEEGKAFSGTVRVSLVDTVVRPVTQLLCELRRLYPGLLLEILSETRLVDLARREADIAMRLSKSPSPAIVNRAVGRVPFGLYAAPGYVERRLRGGRLKTADFERHNFVGYEGSNGEIVRCRNGRSLLAVDLNNTYDDGNECTDDVCEGGNSRNNPRPLGPAPSGTGFCNGHFVLVDCLADADCKDPTPFCSPAARASHSPARTGRWILMSVKPASTVADDATPAGSNYRATREMTASFASAAQIKHAFRPHVTTD